MTTTYLKDIETVARNGGAKAPWLEALRRQGAERFAATGFPTTRDEDWRFNTLAPLTQAEFQLAPADLGGVTAADVAPFLYAIPGVRTLVFVNGRYAPALSSPGEVPAGVTVRNLAAALGAQHPALEAHLGRYAEPGKGGFTALNTAFVKDGLFVHVEKNVDAGAPIHAVFLSDGKVGNAASHPRSLIVVERGARVAVLESYVGPAGGTYFTNAVTEAVVGDNAHLEHLKIQRESELASHVGTTHIHQGRDSRVTSFAISLGAAFGRNNLDINLDGENIESQMLGLYMGRGRQELDNHTNLLHAHPNCGTREVYKGILDDRAHGIFNGKIYVTPLAQKTDAKQTNRALLLSDTARIDTKPQLEIFADDVKCTHGATVGNLDQLAGFYLQSRGIGGALGRKILVYAFAAEILEEIPYESVRQGLEALVMARLDERGEG
ncbi:MAG: Fe-S cluster assembly protein SufD [Gemmatimonadetes bacterium]|nr:Fe-S cluster assembly protein SufD [Gemmatimonadota bacterium]